MEKDTFQFRYEESGTWTKPEGSSFFAKAIYKNSEGKLISQNVDVAGNKITTQIVIAASLK